MRIRRGVLLRSIFYLGLLAVTFGSTVRGGTISGTFTGTFGGAASGSPPYGIVSGDYLSGNFSYGTTTLKAASNGLHSEIYSITSTTPGGAQALGFTIVNKYPYSTGPSPPAAQNYNDLYLKGLFSITITDKTNVSGTVVPGATMDIQALTSYGATLSLLLTSSTYTGLALPSSTTALASFVGGSENLTYDAPFDFYNNPVKISSVSGPAFGTVPEPSTAVLGIVALATTAVGFVVRRRKAAAA